jgi:mRNA interferase MazF
VSRQLEIKRGSVYYAELDPTVGHEQAGRRPVLVVSDDRFNARSGTAIVMPLTSQKPKAGYPFVLPLGFVGAESRESYIKPGQVRTISTERLRKCIGTTTGTVDACLDALLHICGRPLAVAPQQNDNGGE